jgi:hypothetical protein
MLPRRWAPFWSMFAIVVLVAGVVVDVPGSAAYFFRITGGLGMPDVLLGPNAARLHEALTRMGDVGRHHYLVEVWTFDLLLPVLLAAVAHHWITRWRTSWWWLPLAVLLIDWAENIMASLVTRAFPFEPVLLAQLLGVVTVVKFLGYVAEAGVAMFGLVGRKGQN